VKITPLFYHQETSYDRNRMSGHSLDWENQPDVFKTYPGEAPLELPRDVRFPRTTLSAVLEKNEPDNDIRIQSRKDLSRLLLQTYTLTARARHPGGDFTYRSAASAGALYPTEIYMALRGFKDLEDGLYHFSIAHHGLVLLRPGDFSGAVAEVTGMSHSGLSSLVFFFSAIFFRSAWKYRERSYRYHLLDTGHVIENLFLASRAMDLLLRLSFDFDDREANQFLGLDDSREVCLAVAKVAGDDRLAEAQSATLPPNLPQEIQQASRVASRETGYPLIREMHWAGLERVGGTTPGMDMTKEIGLRPRQWAKIAPFAIRPESTHFTEAVFGRRSRRNFVQKAMRADDARVLLQLLINTTDSASSHYGASICTGFISKGVDGIVDGFHLLNTGTEAFGLVSHDVPMEAMASICLDQLWLANAGIHFLFMTNLQALDRTWGGRGYRYAMMTAGRMGERLYLAAESLGLGCCGIGAFYDNEAARSLALNRDSRLLYLVAVGQVKKKPS
jgi:SagB-type dehydrogenase family enzyme